MNDHQYTYSSFMPSVYDIDRREQKAKTILAVLQDYFGEAISETNLLDVGGSTGIIDNLLAETVNSVTSIDVDAKAINFAQSKFSKANLTFQLGDAMSLQFPNNSFDIVICNHIYEHVPDPKTMMREIFRVLKPGGVSYFAGNNRLMLMEPHYRVPLLSIFPRPIAHFYKFIAGKGYFYPEKHLSFWALKRLTENFLVKDYTQRILKEPKRYQVSYMITEKSIKWYLANLAAKYLYWACPYIWLLEKPGSTFVIDGKNSRA